MAREMDTIVWDPMYLIVKKLSAKDILALCKTNKEFNKRLCLNKDFWVELWKRDVSTSLPKRQNVKAQYVRVFEDLQHFRASYYILRYAAKNDYDVLLLNNIPNVDYFWRSAMPFSQRNFSQPMVTEDENILHYLLKVAVYFDSRKVLNILLNVAPEVRDDHSLLMTAIENGNEYMTFIFLQSGNLAKDDYAAVLKAIDGVEFATKDRLIILDLVLEKLLTGPCIASSVPLNYAMEQREILESVGFERAIEQIRLAMCP